MSIGQVSAVFSDRRHGKYTQAEVRLRPGEL